jgi:hypothetical protein
VAYFLIPVYYYPYTGIREYATTVDNNIQEGGNMQQQWIIIYRNEEICHNSG